MFSYHAWFIHKAVVRLPVAWWILGIASVVLPSQSGLGETLQGLLRSTVRRRLFVVHLLSSILCIFIGFVCLKL